MNQTPDKPIDSPNATGSTTSVPSRRVAAFLAITVGVVLFGFLSGIREPFLESRPHPVESQPREGVPRAVNYSQLPTAGIGPNAHWQSNLTKLTFDKPGIFDPVVRAEEMIQAAFADRARNRAYDGAPPTIPHPVEARTAASCLACHGEGLKVGDRISSKISHAHLTNCIQCHVENAPVNLPFRDETLTENTFVGIYRSGPGDRASPGAPPTIPHSTWMRENCSSCHGLVTRPGLRTTHPWLTNCTQCHAPSASLNQVNFAGGNP